MACAKTSLPAYMLPPPENCRESIVAHGRALQVGDTPKMRKTASITEVYHQPHGKRWDSSGSVPFSLFRGRAQKGGGDERHHDPSRQQDLFVLVVAAVAGAETDRRCGRRGGDPAEPARYRRQDQRG